LSGHTGLSGNAVKNAIKDLIDNDLVYMDRCFVMLTQAGLEYVEGIKERPQLDTCSSLMEFKQEALTGITEERGDAGFMVSRQYKMTRAVLTGGGKKTKSGRDADAHIIEADMSAKHKAALAEILGMSRREFETKMREGRIKKCAKCGEVADHHKDGKYIKSHCIECRKKARRKNK
jgi:hypothetical protein